MRLLRSINYYNGDVNHNEHDEQSLRGWVLEVLKRPPLYKEIIMKNGKKRKIVDTERVYVNGLNECYTGIIKAARLAGYNDVTAEKPCKKVGCGQMSYIVSDSVNGYVCYKIEVVTRLKAHIQFCNLNLFFNRVDDTKLSHYDNILNILNKTVGLKITPSSTAREAWQQSLYTTGMAADFADEKKAELYDDVALDDYARNAYGGGWCYCHAPEMQDIGAGIRFDVHSLYPSILKKVPSDTMFFYTDDLLELKDGYQAGDNTILLHFSCKFKIKPGFVPFVQCHGAYGIISNMSSSMRSTGREDVSRELYMFLPEYKVFRKYYDVKEFQFIDGICFELTDAGKWYVNDHYAEKQAAKARGDDDTAAVHKILMNGVAGSFGRKKYSKILAYNEHMQPVSIQTEINSPSHVAVAAYITGCGRARLTDIANQNIDRFLYCDTDSIHLRGIGAGIGIEVGPECGQFGIEAYFDHAVFYGQKQYAEWRKGDAKVTFAGLPHQYAEAVEWCLSHEMVGTNAALQYNDAQKFVFYDSIEHLMKGEDLDKVAIPYKLTGGRQFLVYNLTDCRDWWQKDRERKNSMQYPKYANC